MQAHPRVSALAHHHFTLSLPQEEAQTKAGKKSDDQTLSYHRRDDLKARLRKNKKFTLGVWMLFISKVEPRKAYESGGVINPVLQED